MSGHKCKAFNGQNTQCNVTITGGRIYKQQALSVDETVNLVITAVYAGRLHLYPVQGMMCTVRGTSSTLQ